MKEWTVMFYLCPPDYESCVTLNWLNARGGVIFLYLLVKAVCISLLQEEYIKLVSHFKLETSIKDEVAEFSGGLNEVSFSR